MPKILEDCVKKLKKRGTISNPYAVCTKSLQDAGMLKRGTQKLTEKGKRESRKHNSRRK